MCYSHVQLITFLFAFLGYSATSVSLDPWHIVCLSAPVFLGSAEACCFLGGRGGKIPIDCEMELCNGARESWSGILLMVGVEEGKEYTKDF